MRNQYFQLVCREEKAFIHIYPPAEGGTVVKSSEITNYLDFRNLKAYDVKAINSALNKLEEESELYVGAWDGIPFNEAMDISVSLDKMKVFCRFFPPSEGGKLKDEKEIIGDLVFKKIKYGISEEEVRKFVANREYCKDFVFAEGKRPRHGSDAKIEYFFNTNINLQPKRNDDGSVDYKDLNTISHIKKGDLLAKLIKEDPGDSGQNVFGEEIRPRTVKSKVLEFGQNITINEDRTEIYSDVTGHVSLTNGKVFVSNVYEVPADVDNSIGNINYDGSVHVKGNVKSGFSIISKGDIVVEGVVENAFLQADGQIIIKAGVHGMHKGTLKAGTNVMAKYIENATVRAGGYVEAELVLNSDIAATNYVKVQGRKGLINGGVVRAGNYIQANNLGTEMGTPTDLEVGIEPEVKMRYIELNKYLEKESKELEDIKVIVQNYGDKMKAGVKLPADKLMYVQKMAIAYKTKQAELEPIRTELHDMRVKMMQAEHSYVEVQRDAYPGVNVIINELVYSVKDIVRYSRFKKKDGEVQTVTM